jgi:tetratricopeptide (TPR) repeat protein
MSAMFPSRHVRHDRMPQTRGLPIMDRTVLPLAGFAFLATIAIIGLPQALAEPDNADDPVAALERYYDKVTKGAGRLPMTPIPGKPGKAHGNGDPHAALGPEKLVKVALQHIAEGRQGEALNTLNSGLAKYPKATKLMGLRGVLLLQTGEVSAALRDFEAAVALSPDDVLLLVNRAQAYRQFGREDAALADLDKVLKLKPDFVAALFNRGAVHLKSDKFEEARKDFERCIAIDPHAAAPRFNLAMALEGLGRRDDAVAEMEQFVKAAQKESWKKIAEKQLALWKNGDAGGSGSARKAEANAPETPLQPKATP